MHTTTLGRTGLEVSVAAIGTGGHSKVGQNHGATAAESANVVRAALDAGVNLIDTAASYGTEPIVAEAIKGRRDQVILSSKAMVYKHGTSPTATDQLIDRHELRRRLDASLRALDTDYIDLFHLHGVTPEQYEHCRTELVPALSDFQKDGLIRFPSITERFVIDRQHDMLRRALADDCWDAVMCGYNYLNQTAAREVLPAAQQQNVGTLCMYAVRGPLGRMSEVLSLIDRLVSSGEIDPEKIDRSDPLGFLVADGVSRSLIDAAYRFCRHTEGVDVVVTGTGDIAHLRQNLNSIDDQPLPAHVRKRLESIFAGVWSETGEP